MGKFTIQDPTPTCGTILAGVAAICAFVLEVFEAEQALSATSVRRAEMVDKPKNQKAEITLGQTHRDRAISIARAVSGVVPWVGTAVGELITSTIPNQRMDRLELYVKDLGKRFGALDADKVRSRLKSPEYVALFEDGLFQAARAATEKRRHNIAALVANSLDDDVLECADKRHLMTVLSEVSDEEIIVLMARSHDWISNEFRVEFIRRHKAILSGNVWKKSADERKNTDAIWVSRQHRLERIGLFESDERREFKDVQITALGRLLLKFIDQQPVKTDY